MMDEEELQKKAENGDESDDSDSRAYRLIFDSLRKESGYRLPPSFADNVVATAAKQRARSSGEFLWFGVGIFFLLAALIVAIFMSNYQLSPPTLSLGFLSQMSAYYGLFIFGAGFIVLLNIVDKKLLRRH